MGKSNYKNRIEAILDYLKDGKSREDIALSFNLSNWKSVDMFMRRKGYLWNGSSNIYYKEVINKITTNNSRVLDVIKQFDSCNSSLDPKSISRKLNFIGHREMAIYMEENGFIWDSNKRNYSLSNESNIFKTEKKIEIQPFDDIEENNLLDYLPLLELLNKNKDILINLFQLNTTTISFVTLINNFLIDNNISHDDFINITLKEYLNNQGYNISGKCYS